MAAEIVAIEIVMQHIAYGDNPVQAARIGAHQLEIPAGQVKLGEFRSD